MALVLTTELVAEIILRSVRVELAESEQFIHCKISIFAYVCPPGAVMFPHNACAGRSCMVSAKTLLDPFPLGII
ncbi:MAG TPA: hypothetical protein VH796_19035 [Nitrososphaeraceae archaeon]